MKTYLFDIDGQEAYHDILVKMREDSKLSPEKFAALAHENEVPLINGRWNLKSLEEVFSYSISAEHLEKLEDAAWLADDLRYTLDKIVIGKKIIVSNNTQETVQEYLKARDMSLSVDLIACAETVGFETTDQNFWRILGSERDPESSLLVSGNDKVLYAAESRGYNSFRLGGSHQTSYILDIEF